MYTFLFVVNLFAVVHKLKKPSFSQKRGGQEIYLVGLLNYAIVEHLSIGIRVLIRFTWGHALAESGCQPRMAISGRCHLELLLFLGQILTSPSSRRGDLAISAILSASNPMSGREVITFSFDMVSSSL